MLASAALVLLMVPGLAMFYAGMVRRKNIIATMMYSFGAMAVIGVQWVLVGYCLAFGKDHGGLVGWEPSLLGLAGIKPGDLYSDKAIPQLAFVMFQGKFAIITPALISGAVAERMRFSTFMLFALFWSTFVYCPLAHWVWGSGGWLFERGVLDYAGGTVVHISSGFSALILTLLVGRRQDFEHGSVVLPHNLPMTLTGAGLLWFGWFGFNAGSAVAVEHPVAGSSAALAFATTQTAAAAAGLAWMLIEWRHPGNPTRRGPAPGLAAAAGLAWMLIEWRHHGKPTSLGLASGIVAALVAITPAAGHVMPWAALVIGALASAICYGAVQLKGRLGYDDSLDAFGVHGVGGFWGAVATGIFCFTPVAGLAISGSFGQVGKQLLAARSEER